VCGYHSSHITSRGISASQDTAGNVHREKCRWPGSAHGGACCVMRECVVRVAPASARVTALLVDARCEVVRGARLRCRDGGGEEVGVR